MTLGVAEREGLRPVLERGAFGEVSHADRVWLLTDPQCPPAYLRWVTGQMDFTPAERRLAWAHPMLLKSYTFGALQKLVTTANDKIQLGLAANPSLPQRWLEWLAGSIDLRVRQCIDGKLAPDFVYTIVGLGMNRDLTGYSSEPGPTGWQAQVSRIIQGPMMERVARCGPILRYLVARHPDCPPGLFETLAKDPYAGVRIGVAQNVNAPRSVLTSMVSDQQDILFALAENPSTPVPSLQVLATNSHVRLAQYARANLNKQAAQAALKDLK